MTRYTAQPATPQDRGDGTMVYPDSRDWPGAISVSGFNYIPARPNPDDETETYRPVTLQWTRPDNGIFYTSWQAVNGHRGNRVYVITSWGNTGHAGVMVNGVHIPVQFDSHDAARMFAQAIEDANTED